MSLTSRNRWPGTRLLWTAAALLSCSSLAGCAALTNPVANGIPVRLLPPEVFGEPRDSRETIPLTFLRQRPVEVYRLAPGDVLGVYIEGVLGEPGVAPPVNLPEAPDLPPSMGFPVPVREDGTISLPLIEPLPVANRTVEEAEQAIIRAYTVERDILRPDRARIIVTLLHPRHIRVMVIRQDSPTAGGAIVAQQPLLRGRRGRVRGTAELQWGGRRGMGFAVDLPAYESDVLSALALTGGLPGLDAEPEVVIQRGYYRQGPATLPGHPSELWDTPHGKTPHPVPVPGPMGVGAAPGLAAPAGGLLEGEIIRIPLRMVPGQPPPFRPEDVVLRPGDIVFIEARDAEVFYTAGLLPPGEFVLPRDYDLTVVEAIAMVGGPLVTGTFMPNFFVGGPIVEPGLGTPSPSSLTILRQSPCGRQIPISVDLNQAFRDPRENIRVLPGDILVLQESKGEAMTRYFTQTFNFTAFWDVFRTNRAVGTVNLMVP